MRLRVLIALALAAAILWVNRVFFASPYGQANALAVTECPFRGSARVRYVGIIAPADTFPVRMHENVHVAQCDSLGPWSYRRRNLTARGKLSLEAPGYCAGAAARLSQGTDSASVRERLFDDVRAAFAGLDTSQVRTALRSSCRDIVR